MSIQNTVGSIAESVTNAGVAATVAKSAKASVAEQKAFTTQTHNLNLASAQNALIDEFNKGMANFDLENASILHGRAEAEKTFNEGQAKAEKMKGLKNGAKASQSYGEKTQQAFDSASRDLDARYKANQMQKKLLQKQFEIVKARHEAVKGAIGAQNEGYLMPLPSNFQTPLSKLKEYGAKGAK